MLYDGAFRFVESARTAMRRGDHFGQNRDLQKAQKILGELMSCLDLAKGGEIASNLFALYAFCYDRLVQSNLERTEEGLDEALHVLRSLREAWVQLDVQTRNPAGESHAA